MANETTSGETTGGSLKNADLIRYSEESAGTYASKKHTLSTVKSFMQSGLITVGNEFLTPENIATAADIAYVLGNNTAQTFASYGKTLGQAQADFPLAPIIADTDLVDWAAIYQTWMMLAATGRQNASYLGGYGQRNYITNKPLYIPYVTSKPNVQYIIDGNGCTIKTTSATTSVIEAMPADQTAAGISANSNIILRNMALTNNAGTAKGSGQAGIRIGARNVTIEDVLCTDFDINYDLQFCLHAYLKKATSLGPETTGHLFRSGTWAGASVSNSACNDVDMVDCLSRTERGCDYGISVLASSDVNINGCTVEGNVDDTDLPGQPLAGVFIDTQNSSVVKGSCQIDGLHGEQSYVDGLVHIKSREGIFEMRNMTNQFQGLYAGGNKNLYKLESYAGFVYARLDNFAHFLPEIQFDLENSSCLPIFCYPWSATAAILDNAAFWATYQPTLLDLQKSVYPP